MLSPSRLALTLFVQLYIVMSSALSVHPPTARILGSSKWAVIEECLKCAQGKNIVNSTGILDFNFNSNLIDGHFAMGKFREPMCSPLLSKVFVVLGNHACSHAQTFVVLGSHALMPERFPCISPAAYGGQSTMYRPSGPRSSLTTMAFGAGAAPSFPGEDLKDGAVNEQEAPTYRSLEHVPSLAHPALSWTPTASTTCGENLVDGGTVSREAAFISHSMSVLQDGESSDYHSAASDCSHVIAKSLFD